MIGQINDLYAQRCEHCGGYHVDDLADDDDNWDDVYRQIAEDLLRGEKYTINKDLYLKTAEKLSGAVKKGLESSDIHADRSILSKKLITNVYAFSAAKSATQMKYYRDMMIGDDGAILGKESYIKKIADTGEIFNKNYLSAEYENAYYSTIMADKWDRFGDDEVLEYNTAGDSHVRASHKLLDKYTAPKSAAFWKTNYPPNGWGCRCTVLPGKNRNVSVRQQERFDAGINSLKIENEKTPFYTNVGMTAQIFDEKKHPYFKNISKKELNQAKEESDEKQDYEVLHKSAIFKSNMEDLTDEMKNVYTNVDVEKINAINMYSGYYYGEINNFNRNLIHKVEILPEHGITEDFYTKLTKIINKGLDEIPDKFTGTTYRGTDLTRAQMKPYMDALKSGNEHTELTFMSSSYKKREAFDGNVSFEIKSKTGTMIEKISEKPFEAEVLFKAGQKFKVLKIDEFDGDVWHVFLEEL